MSTATSSGRGRRSGSAFARYAATDRLTTDGVQACAAQAVEIARASSTIRREPVRLAPEPPRQAVWSSTCAIDPFQVPLERYVPHVVFERLQADIPKDDLIKVLYWVATHPNGGDDSAVDDLRSAGLKVNGPSDMDQTRERVMLYALKLLGRLVGKIPQ